MTNNQDWNSSSVLDSLNYLISKRNDLLVYIKNILNDYHQLDKSEEYYNLLLGDWLYQFSHQFYMRWHEGYNYKYEDNNIYIYNVDNKYQFNEYRKTREFFKNINKLIFHYKNNLEFNIHIIKNNQFSLSSKNVKLKTKAKEILNSSIFNPVGKEFLMYIPLQRNSNYDFYKNTYKWRSWFGLINENRDLEASKASSDIDKSWRTSFVLSNKNPSDFLNVFKNILPLFIPNNLLESFFDYRKIVLNNNQFSPKVLYTSSGLHFDLGFSILAAELKENGTKLVCHQHGGNYGIDYLHATEIYESSCVDRFYTWGWVPKNNKRPNIFKPLSVPNQTLKLKSKINNILLCITDYDSTGTRIHFQPMGKKIMDMHNDVIYFLQNLKINSKLIIRMPKQEYGLNISKKMKETEKIYGIDNSKITKYNYPSFSYSKSSIVVHSYLCTSFLETLAIDIPTICFYDNTIYKFRDDALPFIRDLEDVGIIYNSPIEASKFINQIESNIDSWWNSPNVIQARVNFKSNYANFSNKWYNEWYDEFQSLIN